MYILCYFIFFYENGFKGLVHAKKMKMLSLITHPHVFPNLWWNPWVFWPSADTKATDNFKTNKGSKDIVKIVHVTSVIQP